MAVSTIPKNLAADVNELNSKTTVKTVTMEGTTNTSGIIVTTTSKKIIAAEASGYLISVYSRASGYGFRISDPASLNAVTNTRVSFTYYYVE